MSCEHRRPEVYGYRLKESIQLALIALDVRTAPATSALRAEKVIEGATLFLKHWVRQIPIHSLRCDGLNASSLAGNKTPPSSRGRMGV